MESIYVPHCMTIKEIIQETPDIKTFKLAFQDDEVKKKFDFQSGQFALYSVFGQGEATFCISNSPTRKEHIECSIKRVGKVSSAFHAQNVGDTVGFRGPYGNSFPIQEMRGKNLIFAGGGIGLAPLRSLIWNCLDTRQDFGDITIVYGARSTADLVFKRELKEWVGMDGLNTVLTVDPGGEDESWEGEIGFVPAVLEKANPSPKNAMVVTCGPPIMIKFVLLSLDKMGFTPAQVITTLEMKMKCGLGKCGRCNIGHAYVCKHGPVFSYEQLKELPNEY
jgi:sulfhydrogenase subunit gamma (sulfur reductase)